MEPLTWSENKGFTASHSITGQRPAPAIACAVIFFLFGIVSIVNWVGTKYKWYEVLTMAAVFRVVAYSCKASALYHPQAKVEGVFMTLINSGLGASIAVLCISLGNWFRFKEGKYFTAPTEKFIQWTCFLLCFPLIVLGIGVGVTGSVLVYSGSGFQTIGIGYRFRMAGSIGLCAINGIINILLAVTTVRVYTTVPKNKDRYLKDHVFDWRRRNSKLVRSITGVCSLWYSSLWANDLTFYLLDGFPEMLAISMLSVPTLLARCAQFWPPRLRTETDKTEHRTPSTRSSTPGQRSSDLSTPEDDLDVSQDVMDTLDTSQDNLDTQQDDLHTLPDLDTAHDIRTTQAYAKV